MLNSTINNTHALLCLRYFDDKNNDTGKNDVKRVLFLKCIYAEELYIYIYTILNRI